MIRAFVCGCAGLALEPDERDFLAETQPWGLILFRRNVDTPDQLRHLTRSFRDAVGRPDAPVLVDQEGGRVQRLGQPHWSRYPSAARIGQVYATDAAAGVRLARRGGELVDMRRFNNADAYARMMDNFARASRGEESFAGPGSEGVRNQHILAAAFRSCKSSARERVS